jgi:hypothetical protein
MPPQVQRKKQTTRNQSHIFDEAETIDTHISDDSLSADNGTAATPAVSALTPVVAAETTTQVTPISIPSAQTSRSVRAHDVDYFFLRGSKKTNTQSVCKVCRYVDAYTFFIHFTSHNFLNVY